MFPSIKPGIGPVLELLLQCEHGTTQSYQRDKIGGFHPVLKTMPSCNKEWGVNDYKLGIRTFANKLSLSLAAYPSVETPYTAIIPILIKILEDATAEVATVLGDLHYSADIE